jgi:hypothetical protein
MPSSRSTYAWDRISPVNIHYGGISERERDPFKLPVFEHVPDTTEPIIDPTDEYAPVPERFEPTQENRI